MKKTQPVMKVVGGRNASESLPEAVASDPRVVEATAKLHAAEGAQRKRAGAVRIAEAKLAEARDAAPAVSVRLARAEQAVDIARTAAQDAAAKVAALMRAVEDDEGSLEVTEARQQDVEGGVKKIIPSDLVAARVAVEKASRALAATRGALVVAQEAAAGHEAELGDAEQRLEQVKAEPGPVPASVVAAQVAVDDARGALVEADAQLTAARTAHQVAVRQAEAALGGESTAAVVTPRFASLDVFVEQFILPNFAHENEGADTRWCQTWWRHTEAVTRLEVLWEAFEVARLEPAPAMSKWFIHDFDPHMRVMTDKAGVFHACQSTCGSIPKTAHQKEKVWPAVEPPQGQFEKHPDAPIQRKPEIEQVTA